jgi:hypothetical protein
LLPLFFAVHQSRWIDVHLLSEWVDALSVRDMQSNHLRLEP